jgi:hypothetical protein
LDIAFANFVSSAASAGQSGNSSLHYDLTLASLPQCLMTGNCLTAPIYILLPVFQSGSLAWKIITPQQHLRADNRYANYNPCPYRPYHLRSWSKLTPLTKQAGGAGMAILLAHLSLLQQSAHWQLGFESLAMQTSSKICHSLFQDVPFSWEGYSFQISRSTLWHFHSWKAEMYRRRYCE